VGEKTKRLPGRVLQVFEVAPSLGLKKGEPVLLSFFFFFFFCFKKKAGPDHARGGEKTKAGGGGGAGSFLHGFRVSLGFFFLGRGIFCFGGAQGENGHCPQVGSLFCKGSILEGVFQIPTGPGAGLPRGRGKIFPQRKILPQESIF